MKFNRCLAVLFAALFLQSAQAQVSTPDSLVQKLFSSLQTTDEAGYIKLYPTGQQMGRMMRSLMTQVMQSEEVKTAMASDPNVKNMNMDSLITAQVSQMTTPEAETQMRLKFAENHKRVLAAGKQRGIDWSTARLTSYTLDSTSMNGPEGQMMAKAGLKAADGIVDFSSGGTDYQVKVDKMVYIPSEGGWFGGEFKQVIKKGEKFSATDEAETTTDVAPATGSKTKTKTKTGDTKTKTKTSAGKTTTKTKTKG